ncbi:pupal cuticle protein C1B-like [Vanessa cardui]|uniref:pupal cuticle protein C1B-like n=1 Tax=Vanessa cardui TaxID=171605 RepID=UPI001F143A26|nr:pupal cuticle protein C1B-like [Vanessa cardui]
MYSKVIVFLCAAGIASAGNLLHAAPVAYSAPVSSVSYSSQTTSHGSPVATYAAHSAPAITTYSAAPVVAKAIAPAVSYSSLSHSAPVAYAASPYATYAASPAVSYSSVAHSGPVTYAASPIVTKTLAAPALSYSSVANHVSPVTYAASPIVAKTYAAPAYTTYAAAAPAISTYAAAPVLKSAISYSSAPAVSHVTYTGLGASYGW